MNRARSTARYSCNHRSLALLTLTCCLVLAFAFGQATSVSAISQNTTLARAQSWIDRPVPYSQHTYRRGYRNDCSGYVSACWQTGTSYATSSFHLVTTPIPAASLRPGDAMLKKGYHIRLFYGWLDPAHTMYVAYESATGIIAGCRVHSLADDLQFGYKPVRYDRITTSPKPRNVLRNGGFDSWEGMWGSGQDPVWWQQSGDWWNPITRHRKDVYRTGLNGLQLLNSNVEREGYTEISQAASVTAGVRYQVTAYAKTAFNPNAVTFGIAYLDALGNTLAETTSTATRWRVGSAGFTPMSFVTTSPIGAAVARVSVRLAGGASVNASGVVLPRSVFLDDITLVRPQVTVGIRSSSTATYRGRTITLSGAVYPRSAVGTDAVVWIKRPGSSVWKQLAKTRIYASGTAGGWKRSYTFSRTAARGRYYFRVSVPALPGYLGATSSSARVRLL